MPDPLSSVGREPRIMALCIPERKKRIGFSDSFWCRPRIVGSITEIRERPFAQKSFANEFNSFLQHIGLFPGNLLPPDARKMCYRCVRSKLLPMCPVGTQIYLWLRILYLSAKGPWRDLVLFPSLT